jgi:hypothetical protein
MVPDLRSRRQHARDREVVWMAAAIVNARHSIERFGPLLSLVRKWPEAKLCALADRLTPTQGFRKDRQAALAAVERIFCDETALKDRIGQISREVASAFRGLQDAT